MVKSQFRIKKINQITLEIPAIYYGIIILLHIGGNSLQPLVLKNTRNLSSGISPRHR